MSSNKGVVNVQRRTWDKTKFEALAKDRAAASDLGGGGDDGRRGGEEGGGVELHPARSALQSEADARALAIATAASTATSLSNHNTGEDKGGYFTHAELGASGPAGSGRAYLPQRDADQLNLEARVNKRKLVTDATPSSEVGGYYCSVCVCSLRDSNAYLDHLNGTNHQRKLGFSMRVEKSTVASVKDRLKSLKRDAELAANNHQTKGGGGEGGVISSSSHMNDSRIEEGFVDGDLQKLKQRKLSSNDDGDDYGKNSTRSKNGNDDQKSIKETIVTTIIDDQIVKKNKNKNEDEEEGDDPEAAAMQASMGFSGFR